MMWLGGVKSIRLSENVVYFLPIFLKFKPRVVRIEPNQRRYNSNSKSGVTRIASRSF